MNTHTRTHTLWQARERETARDKLKAEGAELGCGIRISELYSKSVAEIGSKSESDANADADSVCLDSVCVASQASQRRVNSSSDEREIHASQPRYFLWPRNVTVGNSSSSRRRNSRQDTHTDTQQQPEPRTNTSAHTHTHRKEAANLRLRGRDRRSQSQAAGCADASSTLTAQMSTGSAVERDVGAHRTRTVASAPISTCCCRSQWARLEMDK